MSPARMMIVVLLMLASVGCSSGRFMRTSVVQPRIEGRVIDADSHEPIQRVSVNRDPGARKVSPTSKPSAGNLRRLGRRILTDQNGQFAVPAVKDLTIWGDSTWVSVNIQFEHPDYLPLSTNFSHKANMEEEKEASLVRAGDIMLTRRERGER